MLSLLNTLLGTVRANIVGINFEKGIRTVDMPPPPLLNKLNCAIALNGTDGKGFVSTLDVQATPLNSEESLTVALNRRPSPPRYLICKPVHLNMSRG